MHLLMKPVSDMVYSSMPSEESLNLFQSVLAKQSCNLPSASSDHFLIDRLGQAGASCLKNCFVSRHQEDIIMVRFAKRRVRESLVRVSVCVE